MTKTYSGSLSLEWFNKQKSILVQADRAGASKRDVPAPKMNWINRDEALFYEIADEEGTGLSPYWVDRSDLRVKEARPLVLQKLYKAAERNNSGSLINTDYAIVESDVDDLAVENLLIRGDNLMALNSLKKMFANRPDEEKVKCAVIDPPYNTGSAFEQYDDNLEHSAWLTMMRDRLVLIKRLLSDDGSLWIVIDDNESHYLKILCDEVFGRANFVANIVWQKKYTVANDTKWFAENHDHILVYASNKESWRPARLERSAEMDERYRNPDNHPKGVWKATPLYAKRVGSEKEQAFTFRFKNGVVWSPPPGTSPRFPAETLRALDENNEIWFGIDGSASPSRKTFLNELKVSKPPAATIWPHSEAGNNHEAREEVKAVNSKEYFATPKPEKLLARILELATEPGDLVLDCFGGSGTTFAVAQKMNRRWIGVEIGKHADTHIIPRLKKVLTGEDQSGISKVVKWHGGGAFKYYKLGDSVIDSVTRDFNWKLGRGFIEKSLLSSYDFAPDVEFSLPQAELINMKVQPSVGFRRVGQMQMASIVSLVEPNKNDPITYNEFMAWYDALKKFKGTQSITVFTNRGVELAYDSKPDDVEVIKIPHAIFAELEK